MNAVDVVARPIARAARSPLFAPLAGRDFRLVWFGESVSLLGDQFNVIALSWLVLGMTGSGFALGAILIAAAIPRGCSCSSVGCSRTASRRAIWRSSRTSSGRR